MSIETQRLGRQGAERRRSLLPFGFAVALAAVTFPLIWVGGLVTTHDAGMAVPDWPGTYGYNLFLYPPDIWWTGPWDLFIEHGHRLLGSLAGLVTIGLVFVTLRHDDRRWVGILTIVALVLVIAQGTLGGVRVLAADRAIAMIHGCVGPAFFALAVAIAAVTSPTWQPRVRASQSESDPGDLGVGDSGVLVQTGDLAWTLLMVAVAYGQLVLGANLRHVSVEADPVVHRTITIMHVVGACAAVMIALLVAWLAARGRLGVSYKAGLLLAILVLAQFSLGLGTWAVKFGVPEPLASQPMFANWVLQAKSMWQANTITMHVATGSAIIATAVWIGVRTASRTVLASRRNLHPVPKGVPA